jgi:GNAT superfamily N-acetyltransferase
MTAQFDTGRVSIRAATVQDAAILVEFRMAMMAEVFKAESPAPASDPAARRDPPAPASDPAARREPAALREANERWLADHFGRDFSAWIAELDGRPVSSAGLMWFPHPPGPLNPGGTEAYILNVYTRPEARRMGIARAIMERVVAEARAAGVRRIWLRASDDGRPLYESMGFRERNYLELRPD